MSNKKVYARNCLIKQLTKKEYKDFVDKNHKQKYAYATLIYGLYYEGTLIQLMSFGKPRFNKNYQWEIIRECTKKCYQVLGGTSRLWKYFITNKSVRSCICYSYPHDAKFTDHYIKYCNFRNIQKAKLQKKIYFEGKWNGSIRYIDKSILERHGVDRLLRTKQGQDRTNEQILLDLGFKKKIKDGLKPQIDIYYPFGILYQIDDLTDGSFYIGITEREKEWKNNKYKGSGKKWLHHIKAHPDHIYRRTILKDNFRTPKELRDAELKEIEKYVLLADRTRILESKGKLKNLRISTQNSLFSHSIKCNECGGINGHHKRNCSKYTYTTPEPCSECGALKNHKKNCSHYKLIQPCLECGGKDGKHYKNCSKYTKPQKCSECGKINGHKKSCSKYKEAAPCPECGGKNNHHKKTCSKYKYNNYCSECGGKNNKHKKNCSKATICPECGGKNNHHYKSCKYYNSHQPCPECGSKSYHKKSCSKYKKQKVCKECGGTNGQHKKGCYHYNQKHTSIICPECQGKNGKHYKSCSKFIKPTPCPECGQSYGHKNTCSFYYKNKIK